MSRTFLPAFLIASILFTAPTLAADGNRLAYLDGPLDPYYPHREFPKLTTPQWVGEEGVECVVTLAIDDMRESAKYEAFLRPILNRLKAIDGRAAVSIMTCRAKPDDPQIETWLKEGLSIECHSFDHPCPFFQDGGLAKAKQTYDQCVDLINEIPGNKPVAFRMPCCDSKNTPSPRFWAEIFNKTTEKGNFLQIDSSVFNIITNKDKDLPKEITELPDGSERFRRYVPFTNFVNTIEDYPYPYVIGGMCWEFPCVVPSDWSAQHVQQPNNPDTLRDWKLALDACVIKKGVFNLVFHPHGWIKAEQIVELIDHAVTKHGKKVKFLTFRECAELLNRHLFIDHALRTPDGRFSGTILIDRGNWNDFTPDGIVDIEFGFPLPIETRDWDPKARLWLTNTRDPNWFGRFRITHNTAFDCRHRDIDGDGEAEWLTGRPAKTLEELAATEERNGRRCDYAVQVKPHGGNDPLFTLPGGITARDIVIPDVLQLIDINADGKLDCLFSNHERYSLHLFKDMKEGWSIKVFDVVRGQEDPNDKSTPVIPSFVRADGTNNGAWFHSGALWLMNEDTWRLPDNVFKLTFAEMLGGRGSGLGVRGSGEEKAAGSKEENDCCGAAAADEPAPNPESPIANPRSAPPSPEPRTPSPPPSSDARFNTLEISQPLSPEESLKALHVRPGMQVELVAAEPLIVDPVAFDWGPDGRLWVVEMRDYPSGITWNKEGDEFGKPGGRVKVLTDVDGDGKYDKAALFLDEIPFPTGIKVWRKGILVTAAPDILYAEDKDGDDKADEKIVLYRGFGEGNQQHRVNGLRWGLDNWLHVGNGDSGGVIRAMTAGLNPLPRGEGGRRPGEGAAGQAITNKNPHPSPLPGGEGVGGKEVNVNGRDLRIRPDTGELDATSGNTQFGRERDDWGNWFGNNNSNPLWHYTLDDFYLRRNPHFTPPAVKKDVSVTPGAAPVFPQSKTQARFNDDNKANRYTSACGPMLYRDDLLGPEFYGNVFVCEPVHNLVSREIISPQGSTFTSKRAADEQKSEFLASEDNWFRPSMVRTGPDGAVWVADMYRYVIEHPKWIPLAAQKKLDLRAGEDKGRIYRIYPEGKKPRPIARLDKLDTAGLVAALDSPNGPQRDLAHQMLIWQCEPAAAEPLAKLVAECKRPQARLQALCALDGLDALTDEVLLKSLADEAPSVRRHAVRLAESRLSKSPALAAAALKLVSDPDLQVRIQLGYSLGELDNEQAAAALARLLVHSNGDPYVEAAALSSTNKDSVGAVLRAVQAERNRPINAKMIEQIAKSVRADRATERLLGIAIALGEDAVVARSLATILKPIRGRGGRNSYSHSYQTLTVVLDALQRRNLKLQSLLNDEFPKLVPPLVVYAREVVARANDRNIYEAVSSSKILARGLDDRDADDVQLLGATLSPHKPPEVCKAAIDALARTGRSEVPALLLANWSVRSPALRGQILDVLGAREAWSLALLAAVESGQVPQSQFDARRRQQFLTARSSAVRQQAEIIFATTSNPDRQKLIETYLAAATSNTGDNSRGQVAFTKRCANCHRLAGQGHNVGPDLSPLTQRPTDYLLTQILDPNRAVEDRYLEYVALTTDGQQLTGILTEDSSNSLLLIGPEGKYQRFRRTDLEQIKSSGKSLMPEGLERDVSPAEMADILAYLRSNAPAPKQLALNQPEVVQPFNDGSIRLFATNCRAYGPTIKMEETWRALGWWNSTDDYCAWSFEVPAGAAGDYRVTLEYSCADDSAGNTAVVEVAGQTLTGQVASSGGWEKYRGWNIGSVKLPEGANELVVRSSGPIKRALFDLGGIRLVPNRR